MHYADIIEGYAARAGDAVALVHGKTKRTWAEFAWRRRWRAPGWARTRRSDCCSTTRPSITRDFWQR
jgi:hypothetical protein